MERLKRRKIWWKGVSRIAWKTFYNVIKTFHEKNNKSIKNNFVKCRKFSDFAEKIQGNLDKRLFAIGLWNFPRAKNKIFIILLAFIFIFMIRLGFPQGSDPRVCSFVQQISWHKKMSIQHTLQFNTKNRHFNTNA